MRKTLYYTYLGVNGTITSPVLLEGVYAVKKYQLIASDGKILTKDDKNYVDSIMIPESDLELWKEIDSK